MPGPYEPVVGREWCERLEAEEPEGDGPAAAAFLISSFGGADFRAAVGQMGYGRPEAEEPESPRPLAAAL